MTRPRLLLVPNFSELEWTIRPQLEEWADVASYDAPGAGGGPVPEEVIRAAEAEPPRLRELFVKRGLEEVDRRGWDRFVLVADAEGNSTAARIARARPESLDGIVLGHASLDHRMDGDRPAINGELWAAMSQLLKRDYEAFAREAMVQLTGGSYREELARQIIERIPIELSAMIWDMLRSEPTDIGAALSEVNAPLFLAKHEDCLVMTDAGFEDAVAAFPAARTLATLEAPCVSEEFAAEMRSFCGTLGQPGEGREA